MSIPLSNARIGIFVDAAWVGANGGHGMRYDVLREFATRDGAEAVRLNVYVSWEEERAATDAAYRRGQDSFAGVLRDFGYKVVRRPWTSAVDEMGNRYGRAATDLEMAVDALRQSEHLERVLLVTGDAGFVPVVHALQSKGSRVEVVGFENTATALREEADLYASGWLVPNLLPVAGRDRESWGKVGGKARGVCYNHSGKGYGFLRYLRELGPGLWITDSRHPDSPFETVFFHDSQLPRNVAYHELPSRSHIFEFDLTESDRFEDDLQAVSLKLVSGGRARPAETAEAGAGETSAVDEADDDRGNRVPAGVDEGGEDGDEISDTAP